MAATPTDRPQSASGPMKKPTFNWETEDSYSKFKTFNLEVNNILSTYNTPVKQLAMVKNWLERKGLQFLEALTNEDNITCGTLEGLFETLVSNM